MSAQPNDLETLKDKDSQEKRHIEPDKATTDSSSIEKENHNDNDIPNSIGPNGSSRQVDAFRRSERITKLKNSVSVFTSLISSSIAAPKGKGGKIEPSTKSKPPHHSSFTGASKACATKAPPKTKTKAAPKPKRLTKKRVAKTIAPDLKAPPAIEEILPFLEERRHLYDAVEYFKDRLEKLHISLDKEADSPSRSVSHDIMLMKAFENEIESLVEYEFPMVLKGLRGLAQAVMGHPDSDEQRLEGNDAGDGQLEEESGKTESREPVIKTLTTTQYKKRPRGDDDDGAEEEGRYHPRQKVAPQDESGQGEAPVSTSRKHQREAAAETEVNDNDYRHSKRSQRFWKGKGKATATHASNVNSPLRLVRPLTGFDTLEDATTTDIDEDEEDKRSESISRGSDPLPSRTRPTQPTAGPSGSRSPGSSTSYVHPPDRPILHIHRA